MQANNIAVVIVFISEECEKSANCDTANTIEDLEPPRTPDVSTYSKRKSGERDSAFKAALTAWACNSMHTIVKNAISVKLLTKFRLLPSPWGHRVCGP